MSSVYIEIFSGAF